MPRGVIGARATSWPLSAPSSHSEYVYTQRHMSQHALNNYCYEKKKGKADEKATKGFWARDPEATPVQRITTVRLTDVHLFLLWLIVDLYTCTGSWQCACMCVCFLVLGFVYYFCVSLGRLFILLCYHEIKIILKIQQPPSQQIWAISQLLNTINEKEVHNTCMLELDIQLQIYCTYLNFFVKRWNNKVLVNQ